jgi:drug/metabolite transporter (DMT)-like permease
VCDTGVCLYRYFFEDERDRKRFIASLFLFFTGFALLFASGGSQGTQGSATLPAEERAKLTPTERLLLLYKTPVTMRIVLGYRDSEDPLT